MADAKKYETKLEEAKEKFRIASDAEDENRTAALDDLRFARLAEQWDQDTLKQRNSEGRPSLTINKMPSFIRQVVNDSRQNKPQIKVRPVDSGSDPETADVMSGLIRNIEQQSNADVAYDTAVDYAVSMGWGYWRVDVEYADDDTFDKDLRIKRVDNPFTIYGDPHSECADSEDWDTAFVTKLLPLDDFNETYKDAEAVDWDAEDYAGLDEPWREDNEILVAEYWYRDQVAKRLLQLSDGTAILEEIWERDQDTFLAAGITPTGVSREIQGQKVRQCIMSGAEVLDEREWAGRYIPIIPVYGEEIRVDGKRYLRSLIRDAKDAQRNFNYWRSASTELVALAPKAPFIGRAGAFDTDAEKWAEVNRRSYGYLEYDGDEMPQRQPFAGVPAGALQEALNSSDDMKAILGMYDASLGARSNETSGKAIMARQREGDTSTFHFIDNHARAIRHTGRILINMIPHVYTGERVIRALDEDGTVRKAQLGSQPAQPLNAPALPGAGQAALGSAPNMDPAALMNGTAAGGMPGMPTPGEAQEEDIVNTKIYDFTAGKYDLAVEAGPSFTTRREEAAEQMTELMRVFPQAGMVLGDILAKNLDWPGADEIAKRLKSLIPAASQENPEMQKAQAQIQQLTEALKKIEGDRQVDLEKAKNDARGTKIDAYEAETKRIEAITKLMERQAQQTEAAMQPQQPGGGGSTAAPQPQQAVPDAALDALVQMTLQRAMESPDILPPDGGSNPQGMI